MQTFIGYNENYKVTCTFDFDYLMSSVDEICFYINSKSHCYARIYFAHTSWKLLIYDGVEKDAFVTDMPRCGFVKSWKVL